MTMIPNFTVKSRCVQRFACFYLISAPLSLSCPVSSLPSFIFQGSVDKFPLTLLGILSTEPDQQNAYRCLSKDDVITRLSFTAADYNNNNHDELDIDYENEKSKKRKKVDDNRLMTELADVRRTSLPLRADYCRAVARDQGFVGLQKVNQMGFIDVYGRVRHTLSHITFYYRSSSCLPPRLTTQS